MKCPKCGYLGFETTERCRHCGYDFSLSVAIDNDRGEALPLRHAAETEAPLADFDLSGLDTGTADEPAAALDLDRMMDETGSALPPAQARRDERRAPRTATAVATPPADELEQSYAPSTAPIAPAAPAAPAAPHRTPAPSAPAAPAASHRTPAPSAPAAPAAPSTLLPLDTPPPARPPLAVRRATPEVPRRRTPRMIRRDLDGPGLQLEPAAAGEHTTDRDDATSGAAPVLRRLLAAAIDGLILGGINAAVVYLTLAMAGLSTDEWRIVPPVPMAVFLLLIDFGYLIGFTAAHGQTIGKMATKIRVVGEDDRPVTPGRAVVRAVAALVSVALAGLPYLPALLANDRRALHDRLARTRVTRHAPFDHGAGRPE